MKVIYNFKGFPNIQPKLWFDEVSFLWPSLVVSSIAEWPQGVFKKDPLFKSIL